MKKLFACLIFTLFSVVPLISNAQASTDGSSKHKSVSQEVTDKLNDTEAPHRLYQKAVYLVGQGVGMVVKVVQSTIRILVQGYNVGYAHLSKASMHRSSDSEPQERAVNTKQPVELAKPKKLQMLIV